MIYIFGIVILIIIILKKFYYKSYNKKETKKTLINKEVEKNQFAENLQKEERKKNMSPKEGEEIVGTFFDEYEQKSIEREKRIDNIFNSEIASSNDLTDKEKKDNFAYKIFEDRIRSSSKNKNKEKEENELEEYYSKAIAQLSSKEYETLVKSIQNRLETLFEKNGGFLPFKSYVAAYNSNYGLIETTAILPFLVEAWNAAVSKREGEDLDQNLSFKVDNELVEKILSTLYKGDAREVLESIKNASKIFSQAENRFRTSPQRPIQESRDIEDESTGDKTGVVILPGEDQATYEYDGEDPYTPLVNSISTSGISNHLEEGEPVTKIAPGQGNLYKGRGLKVGGYLGLEFKRNEDGSYEESYTVNENAYPHLDTRNIQVDENGRPYMEIRFNFGFLLNNLDSDEKFTMGYITHNSEGKEYANNPLKVKENQVNEAPKKKKQTILEYLQDIYGKDKDVEYFRRVLNELTTLYENGEDISGHELFQGEAGKEFLKSVPTGSMINGELVEGGGLPNFYWFNNRSVALYLIEDTHEGTEYEFADTAERQERIENGRKHNLEAREKILRGEGRFYISSHRVSGMNLSSDSRNMDHFGRIPEEKKSFNPLSEQFSSKDSEKQGYEKKEEIVDNFRRSATLIYSTHSSVNDHLNPEAKPGQIIINGKVIYDQNDLLNPKYRNIRVEGIENLAGKGGEHNLGVITMIYHAGKEVIDGEVIDVYKTMNVVSNHSKNLETDSMNSAQKIREVALELFGNIKYNKLSESERKAAFEDFERVFGYPLTQSSSDYNRSANPIFRFEKERKEGDDHGKQETHQKAANFFLGKSKDSETGGSTSPKRVLDLSKVKDIKAFFKELSEAKTESEIQKVRDKYSSPYEYAILKNLHSPLIFTEINSGGRKKSIFTPAVQYMTMLDHGGEISSFSEMNFNQRARNLINLYHEISNESETLNDYQKKRLKEILDSLKDIAKKVNLSPRVIREIREFEKFLSEPRSKKETRTEEEGEKSPPPIPKKEERKKTDEEKKRDNVISIYNKLEKGKTESGNVKIVKNQVGALGLANAKKAGAIFSLRINDLFVLGDPVEGHFGNPFTSDQRLAKKHGLTKTKNTQNAVLSYIYWVLYSDNARAEWIRKQIRSGELKGKDIWYYKELGEPSHATALDFLINGEYEIEGTLLDSENFEVKRKAVKEAKKFGQKDLNHSANYIASQVINFLDISKLDKIDKNILGDYVQKAYYDFIQDLKDRGLDAEAEFLIANQDKLFGLTPENYSGSILEYLQYKLDLNRTVEAEITNFEQIENGTGDHAPGEIYGKRSIELDNKDSISNKIKIFLSNIPDTRKEKLFGDTYDVMTSADALDALHQAILSSDFTFEGVIAVMEVNKRFNEKENGFYEVLIEKFTELKEKHPDLFMQTLFRLSQVSNQMRMVLHSFNKSTQKINLEVLDPNSRDPKFLKRQLWTEQLKKSEVIEFFEGNKYRVNRKKLHLIKEFYADLKYNLKEGGIDPDFNRQNLEKFFLDLGLSFSDKTIDLLFEDPERSGADLKMSRKLIGELLRDGNPAIFNIIKNLEKVRDSSEKEYVFEPTEDQIASKSVITLNPLVSNNSRINEIVVIDNMTIFESMTTVYTGGKTVQSAQNFSEAFVKLQAIQKSLIDFAETGELTGYLASREAESITSHSHLINMIKSNPESLKDYLNIVGDALEVFKQKGSKVSEDNGVTQLNELDHFAMTLGLFLKNEGKLNRGLAIDNFHGLSLRKGYSPFPTISDSNHIPLLQTLLVEFNAGQFNFEERYLEEKALKYLRDSLIKGELKRIAEYIIKVQNQGEKIGIKYYDEGALWINSLFQMNGVLLDVEKTDSQGNRVTEKRPLNNAFREQVIEAIQGDPSIMVILQELQIMDSPEAHNEMNAKLEEIVSNFIEAHETKINKEIHDIYFEEVGKAREEIIRLRGQFGSVSDSPFSDVNKDIDQIAAEFAYNNMLNFNDIYNLFNNDKAFYFKTKALNRSGEVGIARTDLQDIERNGLFIFSAKELIEHYLPKEDASLLLRRIRQAFGKDIHSDELTANERNAILEEFPILKYSREIGTVDYSIGEMIEATHELYMKKMSQIAKDLDENETKRIKKQTSPGLRFLNPQFRNKKYRQIILKDIEDPSKHLEYYASLNGEVTDEHRQNFEIISIYELIDNPTKEEREEYTEALSNIERSFPGIADYLNTAKTDAQERTTWREHLDLLYYMGTEGLTTEVYSEVRAKLERQSESLRRGEKIRDADKLTEEEKKIVVFQPMKPLATGDVMENHHGMIINRAIYVKSSAYPLIPELTEAFPELNAQRMMLEHIQEETGENVRLAYDSAVKVGGTENSAHSLDTYTPITSEHYQDAYKRVLESSVQLDRENFYYQMDVPYDPERDQITLMTQFEKILLGDGISQITEDVFDSIHFDSSLLKQAGVDSNKKKISGVEMQKVVNTIYKRDQKRRTENLMRKLGIKEFEDLEKGEPKIIENIAREIRAQLDRKHDKESVKIIYKIFVKEGDDYVIKNLNEEEYRRSGDRAISAKLVIPLHLNPNSNKMEAVLNSIVNKNNVRLTMSGFSFVVGSEEGFDFRRYSEKALEDLKGKGLILTDFFDPEKGLQRNQVFMTNVLTFMDPDTGKIEKIDLKKYVGEDGILRLKEGDLPQHAFELFTARIPTSAHQSGISVQIAGFLPDHMGDLMIVSKDSTIQIGEDYDIDKRYGYKYNMVQDPITGKISPVNEEVIENLKSRIKWFRKDKKESLKNLEERYQEKRQDLFKNYFLSLEKNNKERSRKFLKLVASGKRDILFTLSELKLAQKSLEELERKKRNNESLDGMEFEKALVQLDLFENTNQEAQDIGNEAENQEPSHNLLKYRIKELERQLGIEGETWREDIHNPNYEERKMLWEEYHKYLDYLNDELYTKKGELFQAYSDYVNMKYISMLEFKADQNNLISAYKSVMETSHPEVQQNISSVLSTEFTGKTANAIHDKVTKTEGVYHSLSYFAQRDKMRARAGKKQGASLHTNLLLFNSTLQQAERKIKFSHLHFNQSNYLGIFKDYEGMYGRVTDDKGTRISSYLMSNHINAISNQHLLHMFKRNENRHTMGAMVAMQMAGYENDGLQVVGDNGVIIGEMSYSSLFISQPIIRDFADIREELLGNIVKGFYSLPNIIETVIKDYKRSPDQNYLLNENGDIIVDKLGIPILNTNNERKVRKILNSQFLYNSLDLEGHSKLAEMVVGKIDHSNPEAVKELEELNINSFTITKDNSDTEVEFPEGITFGDIQLVILRDFLKFREQSQVISELQRFMNIEGSGLGKSFYDVLERKNFLIDLATGKFERENGVTVRYEDSRRLPSLMENFIGKPHFVSQEEVEQFKKDNPDAIFIADLSENEVEGTTHLSYRRGYRSFYITPTTREGHKIVNAISLAYNLWSPLFPYDHESMYIQFKQLENMFNVNEYNREEFFHLVSDSFRDYTYSNLSVLSRGSYQETVLDLFFDDSLSQRESLASYILKLKELRDENGNLIAPELMNSRLIRNLTFSISNGESPSLILYNDSKMTPEENLKMYNELDSLIDSEVALPDRNGREMTVALLMKDLLSYSFIASQERGAVGFRNVLPITLFRKYEVDELLRNRGTIDSQPGRTLVEGYLGRIRSVLNATDSELRKGKVSLKNVERRVVEDLVSSLGGTLRIYGGESENLFKIEGDYLIFPPERFLEDNFGNFITQFVQHNYNRLPKVYPRKGRRRDTHNIYSLLLNKDMQIGIADGSLRQFDVARKRNPVTDTLYPSPAFVNISLKDAPSSLFMLVEESSSTATYIKIDKAGGYGFNEYQAFVNKINSNIKANKK